MFGIKKFLRGLKIVPKTTLESDQKGELEVENASGKLNFHNGTTRSPVVTESHSAIIVNKSIDADNNPITNLELDNLKSGVLNTSTTLAAASNTQVPSALAVKTFIEDELAFQDQASEITLVPVGTIVATNVQAAVAELDSDIQGHINDTVDAHDASAISNVPSGNLAATDVQAALNELQGDINTNTTGISDHIADAVDAHDASAISVVPTGNLAATDVQAALNELQGDADASTTHIAASTNIHGVGVGNSVVGTGTTQTLTNKTITGADIRTPVRSDLKQDTKANLVTYALTATNGQAVFATDTKEYLAVKDGVLTDLGGGGGNADVDTLLVQDFEKAALSDFTQTGLILTETNPINDRISARLVHQPAVNQSFRQTIAVDRKFRGLPMTVALSARSAAAAGDLIIQFRDETNAIDLQESQQIIATSTIQTFQFGVTIPANCASFSYTITALPEAGSPESVIDDIVIRNYWMGTANLGQTEYQFETPNVTRWQDYVPTFQGFGTPTNIEFEWRQVGENVEIRGKFISGTTVAIEARIGLPNGLTSAGTSLIPSIQLSGRMVRGVSGSSVIKSFVTLIEPSVSYITLGRDDYTSGINPLVKQNANAISSPGEELSFTVSVPCAGLTATTTKKVLSTDLVPAKALSGNASFSVPVVTEWQSYVPTFQGFGTPTAIEMQWRRNGQNAEIRGKFVTGATTAVEARVGLPSGLTSANATSIPSLQISGVWGRGATTVNHGGFVFIEPNVSYVTFSSTDVFSNGSTNALSKSLANNVLVTGELLSFTATIPCAGLTATKTETIGLAQSLLVQESDSVLRVTGALGVGSTNTKIVRFANIRESLGSDISYQPSATLGDSFIALTAGVYEISAVISTNGASFQGLSKNSTQLTTDIASINEADRISLGYNSTAGEAVPLSATVYLNAGDVIRGHIGANFNVTGASFQMTKRNAIKQVNPNPNSKITIPTSELRMEGASTRGSTATAIVRFDNIAKIRGDAFEVLSDATLGTRIVMKKKGRLAISAGILTPSASSMALTRNQTVLTGFPSVASEVLSAMDSASTGFRNTAAWAGDVEIGDIIRLCSATTPTTNPTNNLNLSFQEQDISVSVTNTLPQFSESDSSVRLDTLNGYGSTGTRTRRFSNVRDNIGNDIEYRPSAVDGDSFVVKSSGIYDITYTDNMASPSEAVGITRNSSSTSTPPLSLPTAEVLNVVLNYINNYSVTVSWSGYLNAGDVIRGQTEGGAAVTPSRGRFSISKVGKPNVTGVDVTPFVNIPRDERQHYDTSLNSSLNLGSIRRNTDNGIIRVENSPTANRVRITALKKASIFVSAYELRTGPTAGTIIVLLNSSGTVLQQGTAYFDATNGPGGGFVTSEVLVDSGDFIEISRSGAADGTFSSSNLQVVATAASDSIITANESFSTDTANLVYAPSSLYTLATLNTAPVGTFITETYAASGNVRTQTTTAPTQTTADMNVNGIRLFARAFNQTSTAASPTRVAIQIGKGLKGRSVEIFKAASKTTAGSLDYYLAGDQKQGVFTSYNEVTGILTIDSGFDPNGTSTAAGNPGFLFSDASKQNDGYLVINASKSPALTSVPLLQPRIATIKDVKPSGTAGGTATSGAYQTRTLNTIVDPTGLVTNLASNQFVLPAGEYYIEAGASGAYVDAHKIKLRNITDSVDSIVGVSENVGTSGGAGIQLIGTTALLVGQIVISSPKTFELQHRVQSTRATNGFGIPSTFGDNEVYAQVKITKVK